MGKPRLQFTLRAIFLATFWMAVCCGAVIANRSIPPAWEFRGPEMLRRVLTYATFYIGIGSPFIAAGILLGRAKAGVIAGFVATSALIVVTGLLALLEPGFQQHPTAPRNDIVAHVAFSVLVVIVAGIWVLFRRRHQS